MIDKRKVFYKGGFPDQLTPDEEKAKPEFGLQMAKAIENEWFYKKEDSTACSFYDKRNKYHNLRLYARGEQDTKIYKDLITGGDTDTYTNYDWRPLQIIPKFVKLISNQMTERLFDIKAEAIDKYSTDLKDTHRKNLERYVKIKPIMEEAKAQLGVDMKPPNAQEEMPETQEEVDLYMKLKYKPAIEIATEEAMKHTLELNDFDETQSRVVEDVVSIGIGAMKHSTDPDKGILVDYVDPADMVYSYPKHRNFKDVHYYGEVEKITMNELKRISRGELTEEDFEEIGESSANWANYHGNFKSQGLSDNGMGVGNVDVMHFNFKSVNTISYKKKMNKSGGYKMIKKSSTFSKKDPSYKGYEAVKKTIDVWYQGTLVLGTNKIFGYKLCENMIRPKGLLNITTPNYIVYAPELYQNRTKSLVERIIPYVDQMQQIHIKVQQLIAKARPSGIYIDVDGLEEIDLGDGNFLTPLELVKIYDETGNVIGTSATAEGDYNYGREPIKELKNGVIDGLDRLINVYNHYLNLLRDAIGVPQGVDASTPHPDMLVGVQQQMASNSNTATRDILDAALDMTERLGKSLALRLKDIFEYSDLKEAYIQAIGKINVHVLEALKKYHLHDLGIHIELKPDMQEKQYLENNITNALAKEQITFDDAMEIRTIGNVKLAAELMKVRRVKRAKEKHEQEMQKIKAQGEAQKEAAMAASQAKQQEMQMQGQFKAQEIQMESQAAIAKIRAEEESKARLMRQEFDFNMQLKGIEQETVAQKEKYKEDRKDKRQDRANTQASRMIDQRTKDKAPLNFESSEDNISGSVEMSELEPS